MTRRSALAQSISEYILVIGIVTAAFVAMQAYVKRGIQAVIKVGADQVGDQQRAEETDPQKGAKTSSKTRSISEGTTTLESFLGGSQKTTQESASTTTGNTTYISRTEER